MWKKPIDNPNHISILLPTRGRVERLAQTLAALEEITEDKAQVDVWVFVDDDDEVSIKAIQKGAFDHLTLKTHFHVAPRTKTLVETCNVLWRISTNAGIYMPAGDDFQCITQGWDRVVRETFNEYPDRIVLAYSVNTLTNPDDMVFPVLSAEWINLLGSMFTGFFPFWFEDYWLDEIGQMIQRKRRLDVFMQAQGGKGKTLRMKNVPFWYRFFTNTIDERMEIADVLRKAIHPEGSLAYQESLAQAQELAERFWRENKTYDDARCTGWERTMAAQPAVYTPEYVYNYLSVETDAVNRLVKKLERFMQAGNDFRCLETLDNLLYAAMKIKDVQYLRAVYLRKSGRLAEAQQAAQEELILQPGDIKTLRLLEEIQALLPEGSQDELVQPGVKHIQQGNNEAAYRTLLTTTYQYPHYIPAHLMLGLSLMNLGRFAEAGEAYQNALRLDEDDFSGLMGMGKICFLSNRFGEAQEYLGKASKVNPSDREVWLGLAMVEEKLRQQAEGK